MSSRLGLIQRVLLCGALLPTFLYGYIDPGSGSLLFQLLLGGVAGVYAVFALLKNRIRRAVGLESEPSDDTQTDQSAD